MATSKLMIREVGSREFKQSGTDYPDDPNEDAPKGTVPEPSLRGEQKARNEGERLCREGSVEEFQVWTLSMAFQRVWEIRQTA